MTREKRCKRNPDRPECQKPTTTKAELHDSFEDLFKDLGNTINIMTDSIDTTESPVEENENQTSNPGVTTTVYNNLNIKNNKILSEEANRMNLGPIGFELNGWIVLVACFGFSLIFVTLVWKVTKRVCDTYETRALRPPPTIARISGETEDHARRGRKRRKKARRNDRDRHEMHKNMVMDVPIESLSRMVRLQQQQLPGIETNRSGNMPQLMELTTVEVAPPRISNATSVGAPGTSHHAPHAPVNGVQVLPHQPPVINYVTQASAPPVLNINPMTGLSIPPTAPQSVVQVVPDHHLSVPAMAHQHHVNAAPPVQTTVENSPPPNYAHSQQILERNRGQGQNHDNLGYSGGEVPSAVAPDSERLPSSNEEV